MHKRLRLLLIRPESSDPSPVDQAQGARLAAMYGPARELADFAEDSFERGNLGNLERKLHRRGGQVCGIVGATSVPEATHLGQLAQSLNLLCLVANNNPSVCGANRHVFHIGLPSRQTAVAVAQALRAMGYTRVFLLHDETEFQARVAFNMVTALEKNDIRVISQSGSEPAWPDEMRRWKPELTYFIYSDIAVQITWVSNSRPLSFLRNWTGFDFFLDEASHFAVRIIERLKPPAGVLTHFVEQSQRVGPAKPKALYR